MIDQLVDLNAAARPVVTIKIGDRQFVIRRIVTGVRQLWSAFVVEYMAHLESILNHDKEVERIRAAGGPNAAEEILKLSDDLEKAVDNFAERKLDAMFRVIELLLVKNGYEFDRTWWIENAEEADYKDFIVTALSKDSPSEKKKEKAGEEQSIGPE